MSFAFDRCAWLAAGTFLFAGHLLLAQNPPQSSEQPQAIPQAPVIKMDVELVNILYTVHAKKGGALIPNLEKNDFTVFEDGKQQTIQHFSRETDLPLTLGLLIDISASQTRLIDIERDAASAFFSNVIRKKDEAFLISFGKDTELLQDYTNSPRLLTSALRDLQGDGITPMLGGVTGEPGPGPYDRKPERNSTL